MIQYLQLLHNNIKYLALIIVIIISYYYYYYYYWRMQHLTINIQEVIAYH